ncbi:MAG TPA: hypothetical protein K8V12_07975 [Psychrobacter pasteurii]|uniref:Uncharacterized protein n=1 Tax=Psychrobacter pasteurii TaxID=1945520 RepID=A0A1R4ECN2_9GAMM|nr:hypothetical protein [Psychrobacter pasteurii]SJM36262.1 hypothetical protein A1019T_00223 [Psychrobacter pasteurii]HJH09774.1 hypothetical protein [Psychrobacter pasteurii]
MNYFQKNKIKTIESVLTVVGGDVVYGAGEYNKLNPQLPALSQARLQ